LVLLRSVGGQLKPYRDKKVIEIVDLQFSAMSIFSVEIFQSLVGLID
jgi:hypothetical protein